MNRAEKRWFDEVFELLMELEGGDELAQIKGDRGGDTRYGIASKVWPDEYDRLDRLGWPEEEVKLFYWNHFVVDRQIAPLIESAPGFASLLFLGGVHGSGYAHYVRAMQWLCKALGLEVSVDGKYGPNTKGALLHLLKYRSDRWLLGVMQSWSDGFEKLRDRSVGLPHISKGIRRRVQRELAFALGIARI